MEEAKKQHLAAFKKLLIGALYWVKTCAVKSLNKIYTKSLSKTDFTDNNYRSENLKAKIENCSKCKTCISFAKPREFESSLVYNSKMPPQKLMCELFQLGTSKQLKNVGQTIKTQIKSHFEETQRTSIWPITWGNLGYVNLPPIPNELLSYIIFKEGYEHGVTWQKQTN